MQGKSEIFCILLVLRGWFVKNVTKFCEAVVAVMRADFPQPQTMEGFILCRRKRLFVH